MKPEAQRITIAEACGWRLDPMVSLDMKEVAIMCWIRPGNSDWQTEKLPDYLNDLNAMHEAEKVLTPRQQLYYQVFLQKLIGLPKPGCFDLIHATAQQKAQAFLQAIGKYEQPT